MSLEGATVLITGGTGYLGRHLAAHLLEFEKPEKVIIFSRDPHKQQWLNRILPSPRMRYFIGDVRDPDRLKLAMNGVDWVIHTAAIKILDVCEYNPSEAVATNVHGTQCVLDACLQAKARMILISTDKAVEPINLYGKTKGAAEALTLHYNVYRPLFSAVRYGNVMGSTGSVLEKFRAMPKTAEFPITNPEMTRFWFSIEDAISLIRRATKAPPGILFVGKAPSFRIKDLPRAIYQRAKIKVIGAHPREKIHETLISEHEESWDFTTHYRIIPDEDLPGVMDETPKATRFHGSYVSNDNIFLNQSDMRRRIDETALHKTLSGDEGRPPGSGEGPAVTVPDARADSEKAGSRPRGVSEEEARSSVL